MTEELRLDELDLHLTNHCNARCAHCSYRAVTTGDYRDLSVQLALRLVQEAAQASCSELHLTGGEALLHPGVFEIAAAGKSHGMTVRLQTNGRAVDERVVRRVAETGIDWVMISIDGGTAATNDVIRGPGSYAAAVTAAKKLRGRTQLRINSVLMACNVSEAVNLLILSRKLGADLHSFFYFLPIGRGSTLGEQVVTPQRWRDAHARLRGALDTAAAVPPSVVFEPGFVSRDEPAPVPLNCKALLGRYVSVNPDGTFSLCLITEYLGSEFTLDARAHHLEDRHVLIDRIRSLDATACAACQQRGRCGTRCPAHAAFTGCRHGRNDPRCADASYRPLCPFYKLDVRTGRLDVSTSQAGREDDLR